MRETISRKRYRRLVQHCVHSRREQLWVPRLLPIYDFAHIRFYALRQLQWVVDQKVLPFQQNAVDTTLYGHMKRVDCRQCLGDLRVFG
jgi:hypothetical protein